jgi:predicted metal-dependent phosphoesterase TrpH
MSKSTAGKREQKRLARKRKKAEIRAAQYKASAELKRKKGEKVAKVVSRPKRASYSHAIADARKATRRSEGEARNENWRSLSLKQRIAILEKRVGESKKQLARLEGLVAFKKANKK